MPFDSARSLDFGQDTERDFAALDSAIEKFSLGHPYLLFRQEGLGGVRRRAAVSPQLQERARKLLSGIASPPPAPDARTALKRRARRLINIAFIALTAAPSEAEPALAAARETLAALAAAPSWNERPVIRSFLDCAETAVAVALAYDWLYRLLNASERGAIEASIRRNVLLPALTAYQDPSQLWPRRRDNCALVSNSGILIAALSVLARDRPLTAALSRYSLSSCWHIFSGLAPDGAWREGLSYWSLAMRYAGLMVAALESTLGSSFGLAERPGFSQTGDFALHAAGPFGAAFNFGDSQQEYDVLPLSWFAHRFGRPIDGWLAADGEGWSLPFKTIWPCRERASPAALGLSTAKVFRSADLACFRNTWSRTDEARPVYMAIKGGNLSAPVTHEPPLPEDILLHAQADAGTFVVDGARHRWIVDMGSDDYDLPGYFDHGAGGRSGRRWQYYRSRAAAHNTLVIGQYDQVPNSPAAIIASCVEGESKWAVLDLSAAYGQPAGTVRRGAALLDRQIVIQDEIDPRICSEIIWTVHTAAEPVIVNGPFARFRIGDDLLDIRILDPPGAEFELSHAPPPRSFALADPLHLHGRRDGDSGSVSELPRCVDAVGQRAGGAAIRRLQIILPAGTPRVSVLLLPDCDGGEIALPVAPLDDWLARRPLRLAKVPRRNRRTRFRVAAQHALSSATNTRL